MEFAVCEWVPDTSEEAVEALRAEGVTALEPGPSFLLGYEEAAVERNGKRYREAGIRLYTCHAPFGGDNDLSQLDEQGRTRAVAVHKETLRRAALAGVECIVIHPGGRTEPEHKLRRLDRLRASLATLLETAEQTGVRMALENMLPGGVGDECRVVRGIVDEFDSRFLGVCLDVGHAHITGEGASAALANMRDRIIAFHLQDNDGGRDIHLQPPYGTIDWSAFAPEFCAMDFQFPAAVEARPWNGAPLRLLLREVHALFSGQLLDIPLGKARVNAMCGKCGHYCFGTPGDWFCGCDA